MSGKKKLGRGLDKLLGSAAASHRAAQAAEQVSLRPMQRWVSRRPEQTKTVNSGTCQLN